MALSKTQLMSFYRTMRLIRRFEERVVELVNRDEIPGVTHEYVGQEVVPLPEGSRYLGFIFARRETPEEVEAVLREAHGRLEFVITPKSG